MKRIVYSGGAVLTGDAMAHSVALYAISLARIGAADTVRIPVVADGLLSTVELVLGPASQLIIEDAGTEFESEFDDGDYLAHVVERRQLLDHPPTIQPSERDASDSSSFDDL